MPIQKSKINDNFTVRRDLLDNSQRAAVDDLSENIVIKAPAGSGKTSTLITAIADYRYNHLNDRICAITYTRAARAEMESRLEEMGIHDVEVTTIHVWARNLLHDFSIKYDFKVKILTEAEIRFILKDIVKEYLLRAKVKSINIDILYSYITGNKNMDVTDNFRRTLNALDGRYTMYKRNQHLYDFTDYPLYLYDVMTTYDEYVNNIDALFVDEFQDVDSIQLDTFNRVNAEKKFFIGDPWQCQPAGTKVMIRTKEGGVEKNIEDLEIGDPIVYYDQSQGYVSGNKLPHNAILKRITNKQEHDFNNDYLIHIQTESGLTSSYTSNHRTFVRFNKPMDQEAYVVYLMCNDEYRFRVGTIPLFYTGKTDKTSNPWRDKMRAEGCSRIWLLKVCKTNHEALVEEAHISYYYRIPQTCWQTNKVSWTLEDIDYIYNGINTIEGATQCLADYKLDIRYPLIDDNIDWLKKNHYTSNASSEIYALNIIPEYMSCLVYGSEINHKNLHAEKITLVNKEYINNPIKVYSLEVEGGTYVADKIVTHNSIFVFRGADGEAFNKLRNFTQFKLKYNYRSFQEIIDYASLVYEQLLDVVENHDCYISMINWTKPSTIKCDRGYGGSVTLIDPYGEVSVFTGANECHVHYDVDAALDEILAKSPKILCRTNKQVKAIQENSFYDADTVHQAKGLEYDNVIVIDSTMKELEDLNIAYVALTRAKNSMLIINWSQFERYLNNLKRR